DGPGQPASEQPMGRPPRSSVVPCHRRLPAPSWRRRFVLTQSADSGRGIASGRGAVNVNVSWLLWPGSVPPATEDGRRKARVRQGRRVPEAVLLTLAASGGSLGAYAGMSFFRHKTLKGSFRTLYWLIVAAQVVLLAWAVRWSFWAE